MELMVAKLAHMCTKAGGAAWVRDHGHKGGWGSRVANPGLTFPSLGSRYHNRCLHSLACQARSHQPTAKTHGDFQE
jgi:hypothetical protein